MTYPAHQDNGQISRVHSVALREEIGERLGTSLDAMQVGMPPNLIKLMARLRDETASVPPNLNP
jgi:hypothetical protein